MGYPALFVPMLFCLIQKPFIQLRYYLSQLAQFPLYNLLCFFFRMPVIEGWREQSEAIPSCHIPLLIHHAQLLSEL